jgi:hypothetical protein
MDIQTVDIKRDVTLALAASASVASPAKMWIDIEIQYLRGAAIPPKIYL